MVCENRVVLVEADTQGPIHLYTGSPRFSDFLMKEEQYFALVIDVTDYVLHQHCLDVHTSCTSLAACYIILEILEQS